MVVGGTGLLQIQSTLLLSRIVAGIILLINLKRIPYLGHLHRLGYLLLALHGTRLDPGSKL